MSRAAIRYAKAVLSLAQEKQIAETVQEDMKSIKLTSENNADLRMILNSPLIKDQIKLSVLNEVFKDSNELLPNLFKTLVSNKRVDLLPKVAEEYIRLFDLSNNIQEATVTTAVALNDELKEKVQSKVMELTGNRASINNIIDESIIGGFILRVGDMQYNASIAHKLTNLRRELSN